MSQKKFSLKQLVDIYKASEDLQLRIPNDDVVQEYAVKMAGEKGKDGKYIINPVVFPPMTIAEYPQDGEQKLMLVDGCQRLMAMVSVFGKDKEKTESVDIPVEFVSMKKLSEALAFALKINLGRGYSVAPSDRNRRIRLLHEKHEMSLRELGGVVGLSHVWVSAILKGQEPEPGARGTKKGSKKEKKEIQILKPGDAIAALGRLSITFEHEALVTGMLKKLVELPKKNEIAKGFAKLGASIVDFANTLKVSTEADFEDEEEEGDEKK